jgi:hypothetical protein
MLRGQPACLMIRNGTVEKALFTITCTTCQARLIVRSEAAIGAILECPRCTSMVKVVPQAPPSNAGSAPLAPPPLSRVASGVLPLGLELPEPSRLDQLVRPRFLIGVTLGLMLLGGVSYVLWPSARLAPTRVAPKLERRATPPVSPPSLGSPSTAPSAADFRDATPATSPDAGRHAGDR